MAQFAAFKEKMQLEGLSDAAIAAFRSNYERLVSGESLMIPESQIEPVESLPHLEHDVKKACKPKLYLSKCAMLKLNGGLGTGMGLEKAKSLLEVKDGNTFLDLIASQVKHMRRKYRASVKFILMNSFSTSADTRAHLSKRHADLVSEPYFEFLQNKSPKVDKVTLGPSSHPDAPELEWCPPGHGDIYASLVGSGMLDRLLADGVEYLFVSNSDNLGATLDLDLLEHFAESGAPFLMECCARTAADKKGGHLCRKDGKLILRESAQCPDEDEKSFQDVSKHRFFNTNNLWVSLPHLKRAMDTEGGVLRLPLIKNEKNVNPRDKSTPKCLQLETAMGAAIACFEGARAIVVPRSRFAPVKTCADLFALRSDAYVITPDFTIELNSAWGQVPVVKLDDKHYKMVDQMEALVAGYPSMRACDRLTVSGPVFFAAGSSIEGTVSVDATAPAEEGANVLPRANYANGRIDGDMLLTRKAYSERSTSLRLAGGQGAAAPAAAVRAGLSSSRANMMHTNTNGGGGGGAKSSGGVVVRSKQAHAGQKRGGRGLPWGVLLDVAKVLVGIKLFKTLPIDF